MPTQNKRAVRALLFDLDGVLWFSNEAHRHAFQSAARDFRLPWTFSKRVYRAIAGMTTERSLQKILRDKHLKWSAAQAQRFADRKRRWAIRYLPTQARIEPRLTQTLKRLSNRYQLGLVSSGHLQTVQLFLKRTRSRGLFDVVLSSRDVKNSKPAPDSYRAALRRMNIKPNEALAVEDSLSGIQAARRARIGVIGLRGTHPADVLRRAGASRVISRISKLL